MWEARVAALGLGAQAALEGQTQDRGARVLEILARVVPLGRRAVLELMVQMVPLERTFLAAFLLMI